MPVKHTIRSDGNGGTEEVTLSPTKAIRLFCRECYGFEVNWQQMVEECPSVFCPVFPFRFGRSPNKPISDRQREAARQNIARINGRLTSEKEKKDG